MHVLPTYPLISIGSDTEPTYHIYQISKSIEIVVDKVPLEDNLSILKDVIIAHLFPHEEELGLDQELIINSSKVFYITKSRRPNSSVVTPSTNLSKVFYYMCPVTKERMVDIRTQFLHGTGGSPPIMGNDAYERIEEVCTEKARERVEIISEENLDMHSYLYLIYPIILVFKCQGSLYLLLHNNDTLGIHDVTKVDPSKVSGLAGSMYYF